MIWTFLALGLWIVLGGFISYYGDLQGRRWGKKRVSWFGLRPKYTAVLITSLTGGFIALLSIVTLLLIAPDIRDVVLHGESVIRENKRLISEQSKERLQNQYDRENFLAESKRQHDLQLQQAKKDQQDLARGRQQLQQEQAKLQPLKDSVKALQARYDALQVKHDQLSKIVASEKAQIAQLNQDKIQLNEVNVRVAAINKMYAEQSYKYEVDNLELEKKNKKLQADNTEQQQQIEHKQRINEEFYQKNVALQRDIDAKQQKVDSLTQEVDRLTQESDANTTNISQMKRLISQMEDKYSVLLQGQVKLRAGVELSRQSIDAHQRPEAVKKLLVSMMSRANDIAQFHGAAPGAENHAALLPPQKKVTLTGSGYVLADEDAQIDSLAQKWSGSDVPFVVVASTITNCLQGEPVYVELHPYPIVRIYKKGEVVASRQIDGHESVEKIINNLFEFLQKDVQQAALRDGIVPKIDPETAKAEVSVLGMADLVGIFERVRRIHGSVLLTAKAKRDLYSADPLSLTFHVDRVKREPPPAASTP